MWQPLPGERREARAKAVCMVVRGAVQLCLVYGGDAGATSERVCRRQGWAANEICTGARGTRRFASVAICRRSPPTHPYWGAERSGSSSSRVVQLARVLRPAICRCCPEEREPPGSVWIHRNWSNLWHPMRFRKASMSTNASSTSSAQAWTGASQALTTSERLQKTLRKASELIVRSH